MATRIDESVCYRCLHLLTDQKCRAFIDGIPKNILLGENVHAVPFPEQKSGIVFEPRQKGESFEPNN